jgi:hypothetical protein
VTAQIIQFRPPKAKRPVSAEDKQILIRSLIWEIAADLGIDLTKPEKPKGRGA